MIKVKETGSSIIRAVGVTWRVLSTNIGVQSPAKIKIAKLIMDQLFLGKRISEALNIITFSIALSWGSWGSRYLYV